MKTPDDVYKQFGMTPPDDLLTFVHAEMKKEPIAVGVEDYAKVIVALHDLRAYSFRKIVAFLADHGVKTNRTTVFQIYREELARAEEGPLVDDASGRIVED